MNTIVSIASNFTIADAIFQSNGTFNSNQWTIMANWTSGKETLQPADIFAAFSSVVFDPTNILPSVTFNSAQGILIPDQSIHFSCNSTVNWSTPFGIPVGLEIQNLDFFFQQHLNDAKQPPIIKISGSVQVSSVSFDVFGYFSGASPVFILVDSIPTLSLNEIFSQFGITLPENFIEINFNNSQIYYMARKTVPNGVPSLPTIPSQGLNISTQLSLELADVTFPTIDINININNGISTTGTFGNSINLAGFLTLTGANSTYTGGPTLNINSQNNQTNLQLNCGLIFLNQNFGLAGITISKDQSGNTNLSATLSYSGTVGPFQNPSLTMEYSKVNGFQITNWPAFNLQNLIDAEKFQQTLSTIYQQKSSCGAVVNFILNQVETNFTISTQFVTQNPNISGVPAGQFYLILTGSYTISASSNVVCSLPLPTLALSFALPSAFNFDAIATTIGNTITSNAEAVIQQLFDNKPALAQFLLVFTAKQNLQALANQLCQTEKTQLNDFIADTAGAGEGVLGALGAAGTALIAMGCGIPSGSGSSNGSPNVSTLATPAINRSVLNGLNWTIIWGAVQNTNYYEVQVSNVGGENITGVQYSATSSTTISFNNLNDAPYTAQIIAWANPGLNINSAAGNVQLLQLDSVSGINTAINYQTGILSCTFQSVDNASGYTTSIFDGNGVLQMQSTTYALATGNEIIVNFRILDLKNIPQFYKIGVIPTGGNTYISGEEYTSLSTALNWGVGFCQIGNTFNIN